MRILNQKQIAECPRPRCQSARGSKKSDKMTMFLIGFPKALFTETNWSGIVSWFGLKCSGGRNGAC
jgi:hypothetical protein